MSLSGVRGFVLSRLVFNLAALLGAGQAVLWYGACALLGGELPHRGMVLIVALGLAGANVVAAPHVVAARSRRDGWALAARIYCDIGVTALLVACAVTAWWVIGLSLAGLLGAAGAAQLLSVEMFHATSLALAAAATSVCVWGFTLGQSRVEVTRVRVPIPSLAPALDGLRIAQISDLHIGNALHGERLDALVARTNEVEADLLVLTGDLFDHDPSFLEEGAAGLARLRAPHGVYAILGNHDAYMGKSRVADALAKHAPDLRLLRDEIVRLPVAAPLFLAGVDDPGRQWHGRDLRLPAIDRVAAARSDEGPTLLLAHNPEVLDHASELGFPLVLSGHTHGGQIALPFARRINLALLMTTRTRGLYRKRDTTLYVNRGLGIGGPALRIAADREIAIIELQTGLPGGVTQAARGAPHWFPIS